MEYGVSSQSQLSDRDGAVQRLLELNGLYELHLANNRTTAGSWRRFANHRRHVMALALACGGASIALLGAGNCNDVDLRALEQQFRDIHLVDIDRAAVEHARAHQPLHVGSAIRLDAPVDLSGSLDWLPIHRHRAPTAVELGGWAKNAAARVLSAVPATFDTVISTCLLSQLMHACSVGLGESNPFLHVIACATAVAHLRSLLALVRPGGTAVIVTDIVSSAAYPLESVWGQIEPLEILARVDREDSAQSGTAPSFLLEVLAGDAEIAPSIEPARLVSPWLWQFTDELTYLVCAIVVKKKPDQECSVSGS